MAGQGRMLIRERIIGEMNARIPIPPKRRGRKPNLRARRLEYDFKPAIRMAVLARDECTCVCCGADANQVHHLIPFTHGGDNDFDNLISVCGGCHAEFHLDLTPSLRKNLIGQAVAISSPR